MLDKWFVTLYTPPAGMQFQGVPLENLTAQELHAVVGFLQHQDALKTADHARERQYFKETQCHG